MNGSKSLIFKIRGQSKIKGEVEVSGSKNASLAILAASILVKGKVFLENVPNLLDVIEMFKIIESLGGKVFYEKNNVLIETKNLNSFKPNPEPIRKIRGSVNFLGSILARFGKVEIPYPGGDVIGSRPIKTHIDALKELGVVFEESEIIKGTVRNKKGGSLILKESSVTATQILLMYANCLNSPLEIRLAATEPSVTSLCRFLQKAGVKILGVGTPFLKVYPSKIKNFVKFKIPPDNIETGTWIALGAASKSEIKIKKINLEDLDSILVVLNEIGVPYKIEKDCITIEKNKKPLKAIKLQTGLFPKFPTDLQAPFGVLLTQANGVSLIHDWLFESRFGYLLELNKMGANTEILDAHRAIIIGPTPLYGKEISSLDIRSGAALVIASVIAQGDSVIFEAEKIYRGYEKIDEKLKNIGVNIKVESYPQEGLKN